MEQGWSECTRMKQRRTSPARVAREDKGGSDGGASGGRWPAALGELACGDHATMVSPHACARADRTHGHRPPWAAGTQALKLFSKF
jgi:hypothetical protein